MAPRRASRGRGTGAASGKGAPCARRRKAVPCGRRKSARRKVVPCGRKVATCGRRRNARRKVVPCGRKVVPCGRRKSARRKVVPCGRRKSARRKVAPCGQRRSTRRKAAPCGRRRSARRKVAPCGRRRNAWRKVMPCGRRKSARRKATPCGRQARAARRPGATCRKRAWSRSRPTPSKRAKRCPPTARSPVMGGRPAARAAESQCRTTGEASKAAGGRRSPARPLQSSLAAETFGSHLHPGLPDDCIGHRLRPRPRPRRVVWSPAPGLSLAPRRVGRPLLLRRRRPQDRGWRGHPRHLSGRSTASSFASSTRRRSGQAATPRTASRSLRHPGDILVQRECEHECLFLPRDLATDQSPASMPGWQRRQEPGADTRHPAQVLWPCQAVPVRALLPRVPGPDDPPPETGGCPRCPPAVRLRPFPDGEGASNTNNSNSNRGSEPSDRPAGDPGLDGAAWSGHLLLPPAGRLFRTDPVLSRDPRRESVTWPRELLYPGGGYQRDPETIPVRLNTGPSRDLWPRDLPPPAGTLEREHLLQDPGLARDPRRESVVWPRELLYLGGGLHRDPHPSRLNVGPWSRDLHRDVEPIPAVPSRDPRRESVVWPRDLPLPTGALERERLLHDPGLARDPRRESVAWPRDLPLPTGALERERLLHDPGLTRDPRRESVVWPRDPPLSPGGAPWPRAPAPDARRASVSLPPGGSAGRDGDPPPDGDPGPATATPPPPRDPRRDSVVWPRDPTQ